MKTFEHLNKTVRLRGANDTAEILFLGISPRNKNHIRKTLTKSRCHCPFKKRMLLLLVVVFFYTLAVLVQDSRLLKGF